jgi:formate-dependent nitrite reductase membrane component NrfD
MNLFVANPEWGWWIVGYFFLGGIAAGAYVVATLIDLFGRREDRAIARLGYWLAVPLLLLCALFLTVDLHRPERFWHMLFRSELVHEALRQGWPFTGGWGAMLRAPLLKTWSPMSIGSWALFLFGVCSSLTLLGNLWEEGRLSRWFRFSWFGRGVTILGSFLAFFIASYTGALLTATNQPLWSDSVWIAPMFLTSAASTGMAMLLLLGRWRGVQPDAWERLAKAVLFSAVLELCFFAIFLGSLGGDVIPLISTFPGFVLVGGTFFLGIVLPILLHLLARHDAVRPLLAGALLALVGGFALRYGIVMTAPALLETPHGWTSLPGEEGALDEFRPEDGRQRGGGPGADPGNVVEEVKPRSKVFQGD